MDMVFYMHQSVDKMPKQAREERPESISHTSQQSQSLAQGILNTFLHDGGASTGIAGNVPRASCRAQARA